MPPTGVSIGEQRQAHQQVEHRANAHAVLGGGQHGDEDQGGRRDQRERVRLERLDAAGREGEGEQRGRDERGNAQDEAVTAAAGHEQDAGREREEQPGDRAGGRGQNGEDHGEGRAPAVQRQQGAEGDRDPEREGEPAREQIGGGAEPEQPDRQAGAVAVVRAYERREQAGGDHR